MKAIGTDIRISASDLSNHLACRHLTTLDLAVVAGGKAAPNWASPDSWVLRERGLAHERAYLQHLRDSGLVILNLEEVENDRTAYRETCDAMKAGVQVIAQGTLTSGRWFGRPDVLRRVDRPSDLGEWSYEVLDTKLTRETKGSTILQLSLYSELVAAVQGVLPEYAYVVPPSQGFHEEQYRLLDYAAYYRSVKARLEQAVSGAGDSYPEPTPHCSVCRWWQECDGQRRREDHLSLVAGITKLQRKQLVAWDTQTVDTLARFPLPIQQRPDHGSRDSYVRVREQARVQVDGRRLKRPIYEALDIVEEHGLCRLPEPSPGDVFFDLESDPFVGSDGREYLFGFAAYDEAGKLNYESRWALTAEDEKRAFEWFVDLMMVRWLSYPAMHIYHYAPYEPAALKRLMGRYATRGDEVDRVLRAGVLVDLRTVAKQAVRASVEEYSLKALEIFHGFEREVPLDHARTAMRQMEHALELGEVSDKLDAVREEISGYNRDDCISTQSLRDWLESLRGELVVAGRIIPRPVAEDDAAPPEIGERQARVASLITELQAGISADREQRTREEQGRWLLSNLLEFHRRETNANWSEFFRLADLSEEDLHDNKAGLAGLTFLERLLMTKGIATDRYCFELQDTGVKAGDDLFERGERIGTAVEVNLAARTINIKKMKKTAEVHPASVFTFNHVDQKEMSESLYRLGTWVNMHGVDAEGPYRAARDLLLRRQPRVGGGTLILPGESTVDAAKRIGVAMESSVLAIQGPPGAGKTYTGARMICDLVRCGKSVGVTATSHQVIRKLLDEVLLAAQEMGLRNFSCLQRLPEKPKELPVGLMYTLKNDETLSLVQAGTARVVGGTPWLWSREEFFESVDVLFVDEAGQMSLANVLAVGQAAKSIVLLGDPQQLDQPLKGSHPDGAEASALEHLLAGAKTIPGNCGLFLEKTWRLHPSICSFTSEVFYENRLESRHGLKQQKLQGHPWFSGSGLWFVPVEHEGNQNVSPEEVGSVVGIVDSLMQPEVTWVNDKGDVSRLSMNDVLIVAPYNAQVSALASRLEGARVGTVDKFQGQEAPVVIYSLTTSSPEDAPRGMEFLYSLNRLNVASSRAKAVVILVGSSRLLEPECRSPRQMQLANALCRFVEMARVFEPAAQTAR